MMRRALFRLGEFFEWLSWWCFRRSYPKPIDFIVGEDGQARRYENGEF